MRRHKSILVAISLLAVPLQEVRAEVMMFGAGSTASCGRWLAARESKDYSTMNWALGFVSGVAGSMATNVDPLNGIDSDGILYSIDKICQADPAKELVTALYDFMYPRIPH